MSLDALFNAFPIPESACPHPSGQLQWAVGITTAPRKEATLERCLDSMTIAGWHDPLVFADDSSPLPERYDHLKYIARPDKIEAWPNFYLACWELYTRFPKCDAYMMVQDDALFSGYPIREYLDRMLWPEADVGAVSLYTSAAYTRGPTGWHRFSLNPNRTHGSKWVWGACCFIWPLVSFINFLTCPAAVMHRIISKHGGTRHIDVKIGEWAHDAGVSIWHPIPSMIQHIGDTSTIWTVANVGRRKASQVLA